MATYSKFKNESDLKISYGNNYFPKKNNKKIKGKFQLNGCGDGEYISYDQFDQGTDDLCDAFDLLYTTGSADLDLEYDTIKRLRTSCLLLEQNNKDLDYIVKRLSHENKCYEPRINQLKELNKSFSQDNAECLGRSVENKFLIKDVTKMKDLLNSLTRAVNEEVTNHCKLQENYFKAEFDRKQFEKDKMSYELSSIATGQQLNNLSNKKAYLESCKEELIKKHVFLNRLQDIKGIFRVILKVNKFNKNESNDTIFSFIGDDKIGIKLPVSNSNGGLKIFQFNKVFGSNSGLSDIADILSGSINQVINGFNVCLIHFGISGSGKTYTVTGNLPQEQGISSILLSQLIDEMNKEHRLKFKLEASFLEFYNDNVMCLLSNNKIKFQDTGEKIILGNYKKECISSLKQFNFILQNVVHRRQTSATKFCTHASRSHLVLIIGVKSENSITCSKTNSKIMIFDLAGFEKSNQQPLEKMRKQHLDETFYINNSLASFSQIIEEYSIRTLQSNNKKFQSTYPFRSNKLMQFLKPCFCGDAFCYLILHVSDDKNQIYSIHKTLHLGQCASSIELGRPFCHKTESVLSCASKYII